MSLLDNLNSGLILTGKIAIDKQTNFEKFLPTLKPGTVMTFSLEICKTFYDKKHKIDCKYINKDGKEVEAKYTINQLNRFLSNYEWHQID